MRARDVLAGEDSVKSAGEKYLPRLNDQSEDEYHNYRARASFFNATARTTEGYVGLLFRRPPFLKLPDPSSALGQALATFAHDADLLGTSLNRQWRRSNRSAPSARPRKRWQPVSIASSKHRSVRHRVGPPPATIRASCGKSSEARFFSPGAMPT